MIPLKSVYSTIKPIFSHILNNSKPLFDKGKILASKGLTKSKAIYTKLGGKPIVEMGKTPTFRAMSGVTLKDAVSLTSLKIARREVGSFRYTLPIMNVVGMFKMKNILKIPSVESYIAQNQGLVKTEIDELKKIIPVRFGSRKRLMNTTKMAENFDETFKLFTSGKISSNDIGKSLHSASDGKITLLQLAKDDRGIADRVNRIQHQAEVSKKLIGTKMMSTYAVIGIPSFAGTVMQYKYMRKKIQKSRDRVNHKSNHYNKYIQE